MTYFLKQSNNHNLKGSFFEGVIGCFVLFTLLFFLQTCLTPTRDHSLPAKWNPLCFLCEKTHGNKNNYTCRAGGGKERRRDGLMEEREKEEEWYADSLWPFSLLHQQHHGYLYIGVGCSTPLYKPLRAHVYTQWGGGCGAPSLVFFFESFTHTHQDVSFQLRLWEERETELGTVVWLTTGLSPRCLNAVPGLPGRGHGDELMEMFYSHRQSVSVTVSVQMKLSSIVSNKNKKNTFIMSVNVAISRLSHQALMCNNAILSVE